MSHHEPYSQAPAPLEATVAFYRNILILIALGFVVGFVLLPWDPFNNPMESIVSHVGNHHFFAVAIFGAFVILALSASRRLLWWVLAGAAPIAAAMYFFSPPKDVSVVLQAVLCLATGLGVASIGVLCAATRQSEGVERPELKAILYGSLIVPFFVLQSIFYLQLTYLLHPLVLDPLVYAVDSAFGAQWSFEAGKLFRTAPVLKLICEIVYLGLPASLAAVFALESKRTRNSSGTVLTSFITAAVCGFVLYHFFPVVGPAYAFAGDYPLRAPMPGAISLAPMPALPVPRNCMPSLHLGWVILQWWHARSLSRRIRWCALVWLILTVAATLGIGLHYVIDLIVAVPFSAAVRGIASLLGRERNRAAEQLALWGGIMTIGWLIILRFSVPVLVAYPALTWALSIATTSVSLILERRLRPAGQAWSTPAAGERAVSPSTAKRGTPSQPLTSRPVYAIGAVFVLSGFSGLVYEVVFAKCLALTFGSAATASTTVLATYMGGIAIGSWIGGRIGAGRVNSLQLYGYCEIGIGLWCALSPLTWSLVRHVYVALAGGVSPGSPALTSLQIGLGGLALLPPTILMGITLPVLARRLTDLRESLGGSVGLLYGANTLGAALGALGAGYVLLPGLGVTHTTLLAVALNFAAGLIGFRLQRKFASDGSSDLPGHMADQAGEPDRRKEGLTAVAILFFGGVLTLALEIIYIHLLAVVVGNSAYAFSLMLFTFLIGLSFGSALARNCVRLGFSAAGLLGFAELCLAAVLLAGVFFWDLIPAYFASFDGYSVTNTFRAREIVRGIVSFLVMVPPTLCIGAYYPVAMELIGRSFPQRKIAALGWAAALNTTGNIVGVLLGAFVLLPFLGSLVSIQVIAGAAACLGLIVFIALPTPHRGWTAPCALGVGALFMVQPHSFDMQSLSSGANVYFHLQGYGKVIDHAESMDGGLTSIAESWDANRQRVLTMLTNGKFQGDDSPGREMAAQAAFALCPLLHTAHRERAAVIGLGTGVSAKTINDAGFSAMDLAELSADVLHLAEKHFAKVNEGVFNKPGVRTHITDGRNFMLLQPISYDLISMEISSIWFAGAANLYNREFYRLIKGRLTEEGVFQQWIQLHRIRPRDVLSVLLTVRSEFRYVWLYFIGKQGIIVASEAPMAPSFKTIAALDAKDGLKDVLGYFGGSSRGLLRERLLDPIAVDQMLAEIKAAGLYHGLISTDDNLLLEYSTPKGNVNPYGPSLAANVSFLARFKPPSLTRGTSLTEEFLIEATP